MRENNSLGFAFRTGGKQNDRWSMGKFGLKVSIPERGRPRPKEGAKLVAATNGLCDILEKEDVDLISQGLNR